MNSWVRKYAKLKKIKAIGVYKNTLLTCVVAANDDGRGTDRTGS